MNTQECISFIGCLFKPIQQRYNDLNQSIYEQQANLTGTPNWIYAGHFGIQDKKQKVVKLHTSLTEQAKTLIELDNQINDDKAILLNYFDPRLPIERQIPLSARHLTLRQRQLEPQDIPKHIEDIILMQLMEHIL